MELKIKELNKKDYNKVIQYAINDSKEKGKSGICTLVSKKKKPFIGEKKFFEH